jgi:hypothetical protein
MNERKRSFVQAGIQNEQYMDAAIENLGRASHTTVWLIEISNNCTRNHNCHGRQAHR